MMLSRTLVLAGTAAIVASGCDSPRTATEAGEPTAISKAAPTQAAQAATSPAAPVSFQKDLTSGDYRFAVQTTGAGSQRQLTLRAERNGQELANNTEALEGTITDAVATNLNDDDYPELLVFVSDAGSGSYGRLVGYEFLSRGRRSLTLPELSGAAAEGYMGQDVFRVEGNKILRSFPIYRPTDPNSTPSGGTRTVEYVMPKGATAISFARFTDQPK